MTDTDRQEFAGILVALGEVFNETVSTVRAGLYFEALKEFSMAEIKQASQVIATSDRFFPKPVDFIERLKGSTEDQAETAWAKLLQQIRWEGYTGKPNLSPATLEVVIALWGSWVNLCQTLPGEGAGLFAWQKRFVSAYGAGQRMPLRLSATEDLPFDTLQVTAGEE